MIVVQLDHGDYRARIERHGAGWQVLLCDRRTEAGRRGVPCQRSPTLATLREGRRWAWEQMGYAVIPVAALTGVGRPT